MRPQTEVEKALEELLYTSRVLVLLECDGHFHQVALSRDQLIDVLDIIEAASIPDPVDPKKTVAHIRMRRECVKGRVFENMRDYYEQEELAEMDKFVETHDNEST